MLLHVVKFGNEVFCV